MCSTPKIASGYRSEGGSGERRAWSWTPHTAPPPSSSSPSSVPPRSGKPSSTRSNHSTLAPRSFRYTWSTIEGDALASAMRRMAELLEGGERRVSSGLLTGVVDHPSRLGFPRRRDRRVRWPRGRKRASWRRESVGGMAKESTLPARTLVPARSHHAVSAHHLRNRASWLGAFRTCVAGHRLRHCVVQLRARFA
jgi:hypothetical protein